MMAVRLIIKNLGENTSVSKTIFLRNKRIDEIINDFHVIRKKLAFNQKDWLLLLEPCSFQRSKGHVCITLLDSVLEIVFLTEKFSSYEKVEELFTCLRSRIYAKLFKDYMMLKEELMRRV